MTFTKRADPSQVDRCYHELRRLIVSREIEPGTRLTEKELIARLGFGRTPVREALLRLNQDRLVDTMPRSGYRVTALTKKSVRDFFRVWKTLGPLVARLAVENMNEKMRSEVITLGKQRDGVLPHDAAELSRIAASFFDLLVKAADNAPLTYIYNHLGAEMERVFQPYFESPEGRQWLGSGREIAAFANVSNPDLGAKLVEQRLAATEVGVIALMSATP